MGTKTKSAFFRAIYQRYREARLLVKTQILEEFGHVCGYNQTYLQRSRNPVQTSCKAPAPFAHPQLSSPRDPASHLEGVGLPWSVRREGFNKDKTSG